MQIFEVFFLKKGGNGGMGGRMGYGGRSRVRMGDGGIEEDKAG